MHRHDTNARSFSSKQGRIDNQSRTLLQEEPARIRRRKVRRQWRQERRALQQLDPKALDEYLLDHE